MRVLIADNQPSTRSALRLVLELEPECHVIAECDGRRALVDAAREHQPDVVLLNWELSPTRCAWDLDDLRIRSLGMRIIALSVRPEARSEATAAGADAFVHKGDPPEVLLATVRRYALPGGSTAIKSTMVPSLVTRPPQRSASDAARSL